MTELNKKALQHLIDNAKSTTKASSAGSKILPTAKAGEYKIEHIRIILVAYSIEYKTWTVEISVKKDFEAAQSMKRFKLTVDKEQVTMWQKVQMDMVQEDKSVFNFDEADEILPETNLRSDGSDNSFEDVVAPTNEEGVSISENEPIINGSCDECNLPNGKHSPFCKNKDK